MFSEQQKHWLSLKSSQDRLVFFCDAIFAIAITLLILQIDVPAIVYEADVDNVLVELWPRFVSFAISFFVIARFWLVHLNLFAHVRRLDMKLIVITLVFMSLIVFLPFTTDFYGAHSDNKYVLTMYVLSIVATSLLSHIAWRYVLKKPELLLADRDTKEMRRHSWRGLLVSLEFVLALLIVYIDPILEPWYWLIFVVIVAIVFISTRLTESHQSSVAKFSA
jgi:uncharacterized membrane protein